LKTLSETLTRALRRYLLGRGSRLVFERADTVELPPIRETGLYIHIPFCKATCPYCPYNKVEYDRRLIEPYVEALLVEVERYYARLGAIDISSVYIGGGTPTLLSHELPAILGRVRDRFNVKGDICIETNPSDVGEETVARLLDCGVRLVSVGVQSFDDRYLDLIGRNYHASSVHPALELLLSAGFDSVNLDLMFALPGQTVAEVLSDLHRAIDSGADQVTLYPLFTFPYTAAGKYLNLRRVKMPSIVARRRMYRAIHRYCLDNGFERVSVWGFNRGDAPRYSSVTRDDYIGLGAGAGSHVPGAFYFNTFSVEEYIRTCLHDRLPVAFSMDVTGPLSRYYWLYWRLYDSYIPKAQLSERFRQDGRRVRRLLALARLLGLCEEEDERFCLTESGAFWLHLLQNYFALDYIDRVWSVAMAEPWPNEIRI